MKLPTPLQISLFGIALAACQSTPTTPAPAPDLPATRAHQDVRHGMADADGQYAIGRYYQAQQRHAEAIAAFRRLIAAQPNHGDAHNRLGLSLAAQGDLEAAIAAFRSARELAPGEAAIHNNLGYALLLRGRLDEAIDELLSALILAPGDERARDNYDQAMARRSGPDAPAPEIPPGLPPADMPPPVYVIAGAETNTDKAAAAEGKTMLRLEITNGNGVAGLARRTSHALASAGYLRPRLTNAPAYNVKSTVIEYRPGQEQAAARLQQRLDNKPPTVLSNTLREDIGMRLLLGHDGRSQDALVSARLDP